MGAETGLWHPHPQEEVVESCEPETQTALRPPVLIKRPAFEAKLSRAFIPYRHIQATVQKFTGSHCTNIP